MLPMHNLLQFLFLLRIREVNDLIEVYSISEAPCHESIVRRDMKRGTNDTKIEV